MTTTGFQETGKRPLVARGVTEVFAPSVLAVAILLIVAVHSGALLWGIVAAVFAVMIPLSYIIRGVRRGRFDNHHVSVRERRPAILVLAAVSVVVGLSIMVWAEAPRQLVALVVAMLTGLVLSLAVTFWWKVSIHTAVAAGTAIILMLIFGWAATPAWLVVIGVGWSRVVLRDHTVAQVIGGALLGLVAAGGVYPLLA